MTEESWTLNLQTDQLKFSNLKKEKDWGEKNEQSLKDLMGQY